MTIQNKKMKGIILAGGTGTRLLPLTATTSKQLLPVYDRQMIFYPINTLLNTGIKHILIIVSPQHSGNYLNLLGSIFSNFGINISFAVQKEPRGLPEAFILGENFIGNDNVCLVLGDNIFEYNFVDDVKSFENGARVFAKKVNDPERFGVVEFDENKKVISIEEKPKVPKSNFAIPGIYIYDNRVVDFSKNLKPSIRNEIEIVDLHNAYLKLDELDVREIQAGYFDAGTHDALLEASNYVKENKEKFQFSEILENAIKEFNIEFKKLVAVK
jgi:glucose-1-phosphate thymidylyltransferase